MNLADAVKKCAVDAMEAQVPCDVIFGSVEETEPVTVKAGQLVLTKDLLFVAEHLKYREYCVSFGGYDRVVVINEGLQKGDRVAVLRQRGGEGYVVFAKV